MLTLLATKVHVARNEPKKKRTENNSPPERTHGAHYVQRGCLWDKSTAGSWNDSDDYPDNGAGDEERNHP